MRLIICVLLSLSITFTVHAQQEENTQDSNEENPFILGGSLNFSFAKNTLPGNFGFLPYFLQSQIIFTGDDEDVNISTYSLQPYFGKEINPNWALGLQLGYDYTKFDQTDDQAGFSSESSVAGYSIGAFARYNFNPDQKLNFFIQPYFEYSSRNQNTSFEGFSPIELDANINLVDIGVNGGFLYNFNENVRATLQLGLLNYVSGNYSSEFDDNPNLEINKDFSNFGLNLRMSSVFFGIELKL